MASAGYLTTMGIPVVRGRGFTDADRAGGQKVLVLTESAARKFFPDENPIGQQVRFGWGEGVDGEIVGVVGDAKYLDLREVPPRTIYLNAYQEPRMIANRLALSTAGRPGAFAADVQRIIREQLNTVAISNVTTMDDLVDQSIVPERVMFTRGGPLRSTRRAAVDQTPAGRARSSAVLSSRNVPFGVATRPRAGPSNHSCPSALTGTRVTAKPSVSSALAGSSTDRCSVRAVIMCPCCP